MMDERKMRILQAITDDYIMTAEPVGSRSIARKYQLGVSPATIRNEMADLEELGYLQQPHTSAGRIPSDQGYRFYVDALMDRHELSPDEAARLRHEVATRQRAIEEIIHRTARLLALFTRYTSLVAAPRREASVFRHIQLIRMDDNHVLAVLVVDPGFVQNRIIELDEAVAADELRELADFLNHRLRGVTLHNIGRTLLTEVREEIRNARLCQHALHLLEKSLGSEGEEQVYLDGTLNILHQPEFRDIDRARALLEALEEKDALVNLLSEAGRRPGTAVTIGHENAYAEMHDCSIVTAAYRVGGRVIGTIGVLGPTRMEYSRVVTLVELMAQNLSRLLTDLTKR